MLFTSSLVSREDYVWISLLPLRSPSGVIIRLLKVTQISRFLSQQQIGFNGCRASWAPRGGAGLGGLLD